MRIFVYEFVTGGGWYVEDPSSAPTGSLLVEGAAMAVSIVQDFAAIPDCHVTVLQDCRLQLFQSSPNLTVTAITSVQEMWKKLLAQASASDAVLIIAPELQGRLTALTKALHERDANFLTLPIRFVDLASDKLRTYLRWKAQGVPTPDTTRCFSNKPPPKRFSFPLIYKPNDGCGSKAIKVIRSNEELLHCLEQNHSNMIWQKFVPGRAASVAALCGPKEIKLMPPCWQALDADFFYLGGSTISHPKLASRAKRLAKHAIEAVGKCNGYVGIDLILGEAKNGSQDYVIEINPRLTTSYVGLRALSETNLAQAMLDVASGKTPDLRWKPGSVSFTADGRVSYRE